VIKFALDLNKRAQTTTTTRNPASEEHDRTVYKPDRHNEKKDHKQHHCRSADRLRSTSCPKQADKTKATRGSSCTNPLEHPSLPIGLARSPNTNYLDLRQELRRDLTLLPHPHIISKTTHHRDALLPPDARQTSSLHRTAGCQWEPVRTSCRPKGTLIYSGDAMKRLIVSSLSDRYLVFLLVLPSRPLPSMYFLAQVAPSAQKK
jgi:hypothetical protein